MELLTTLMGGGEGRWGFGSEGPQDANVNFNIESGRRRLIGLKYGRFIKCAARSECRRAVKMCSTSK